MKHLILLLLFQGSLDCFAQAEKLYLWPDGKLSVLDPGPAIAPKPDTIPEWMHVSITRAKGFVMARKALSVRVNGICVTHLDCEGKPFPVHYKVGWCEGREGLIERLVKQLR